MYVHVHVCVHNEMQVCVCVCTDQVTGDKAANSTGWRIHTHVRTNISATTTVCVCVYMSVRILMQPSSFCVTRHRKWKSTTTTKKRRPHHRCAHTLQPPPWGATPHTHAQMNNGEMGTTHSKHRAGQTTSSRLLCPRNGAFPSPCGSPVGPTQDTTGLLPCILLCLKTPEYNVLFM